MSWLTIITFAVKGINNVSGWLKRKVKRDRVQGMDEAVDSGDDKFIRHRLRKLKRKAKDNRDSR
jgi:hypothetical protein